MQSHNGSSGWPAGGRCSPVQRGLAERLLCVGWGGGVKGCGDGWDKAPALGRPVTPGWGGVGLLHGNLFTFVLSPNLSGLQALDGSQLGGLRQVALPL